MAPTIEQVLEQVLCTSYTRTNSTGWLGQALSVKFDSPKCIQDLLQPLTANYRYTLKSLDITPLKILNESTWSGSGGDNGAEALEEKARDGGSADHAGRNVQ